MRSKLAQKKIGTKKRGTGIEAEYFGMHFVQTYSAKYTHVTGPSRVARHCEIRSLSVLVTNSIAYTPGRLMCNAWFAASARKGAIGNRVFSGHVALALAARLNDGF